MYLEFNNSDGVVFQDVHGLTFVIIDLCNTPNMHMLEFALTVFFSMQNLITC